MKFFSSKKIAALPRAQFLDSRMPGRDGINTVPTEAEKRAYFENRAKVDLGIVWDGTAPAAERAAALGRIRDSLEGAEEGFGSQDEPADKDHPSRKLGTDRRSTHDARRRASVGTPPTPAAINSANSVYWSDRQQLDDRAAVAREAARMSEGGKPSAINAANRDFWNRQPAPTVLGPKYR